MNASRIGSGVVGFISATGMILVAAVALAETKPANPGYSPSDVPKQFKAPSVDRDYTRRIEMVRMRDGVKLQTIIDVPKGARNAPILLTRTPYDAKGRATRSSSASLKSTLPLADEVFVQAGYIRVYQMFEASTARKAST